MKWTSAFDPKTPLAAVPFACLALIAAAGPADGQAAEKDVFARRREWKLVATEVADADMPLTMQVAAPLHGPWLTLPQPDAISVSWIAGCTCGGGVEYRLKGTQEWQVKWEVKCGQIDCSKAVHTVRLADLRPGAEYEYRLCTIVDPVLQGATDYFDRERILRTFRTVDPAKSDYRVFLASDIHGCFNMNLDYMMAAVRPNDFDCYFLLGDNVSDGVYMDIEHIITRGFLDDISRWWGASKPTVIMRGNHDIHGRDTYKWGDYFPQPDGKTYSAFRQGPVFYVALDTMWPPRSRHQAAAYAAYLKEQADWVRALKRTADWKEAKFRLVMGHVAPWPCNATLVGPAFTELLSDESPEGRIHAFISGHHHCYYRINPNTRELRFCNRYGDFDLKRYPEGYFAKTADEIPARFPYVNLILHAHEAMTVDVSSEKLTFRSHRWYAERGGLYDAFELHPDGTVRELLDDITVLPIRR